MEFESVKPRVEFLLRKNLPAPGNVVVEGTFSGSHEGKHGTYHAIKTTEGLKGLPGSRILDEAFEEVSKGEQVRVVYNGEATSQAGNMYQTFDVQVARETQLPLPTVETEDEELNLD